MEIRKKIEEQALEIAKTLYDVSLENLPVQRTKKDFEGDYTLVVFPLTKAARKAPPMIANEVGEAIKKAMTEVESFNAVQGFLNLKLTDEFWIGQMLEFANHDDVVVEAASAPSRIMVEYSSPNTNKPLHLGHIRNNLLGYSISEILKAKGHTVIKANLVNDRGVHICKSMLAWQKFGNGETPESSGLKGDALVGKYYVEFDRVYKKEVKRIETAAEDAISNKRENEHIKLINKEFENKRNELFAQNFSHLPPPLLTGIVSGSLIGLSVGLIANALKDKKQKSNEDLVLGLATGILTTAFVTSAKKSEIDKRQLEIDQYIEKEKQREITNQLDAFQDEFRKGISKYEIKDQQEKNIYSLTHKLYETFSPILSETREMLRKWEAGDTDVLELWKTMNGWVYAGHNATYERLGVDFDQFYYESNTYKLGKDLINEGLKKGVFYQKDDGSIWCDLTEDGLDEKLLLRSDGTSVYMTQDVGTADLKYQDHKIDRSFYVVGNEQEYHFKVLKLICQKLGKTYADGIYHFSYGMIDLPEGKMKSREGTVVDADDLITEMEATAKTQTEELGKIDMLSDDDKEHLYYTLGMGALKYYLLKTDPKRRITFNPAESIDFQGNTGPFIQYTHARIKSVERKAEKLKIDESSTYSGTLKDQERELSFLLNDKETILNEAAENLSPAVIANYCYEIAKAYNGFYHECPILQESNQTLQSHRVLLNRETGKSLRFFMALLGIELPERM